MSWVGGGEGGRGGRGGGGYESLGMIEGKRDLVIVYRIWKLHNPLIPHSSECSSYVCIHTCTGTGAPQCG